MADEIVLFQTKKITLIQKPVADDAVVDLLTSTVYGTTGIQYRQTGQEQKIRELNNPLFFHLYVYGILQGIYCLDHRIVDCMWGKIDAFYGRYLAVSKECQNLGYGRLLKKIAVGYIEREIDSPYLLYSYIEAKNTRSLKLSIENGFLSMAQFKTFRFCRLFPKTDRRVSRYEDSDLDQVKEYLNAYYAEYGFRTFFKIGDQGHYFGLKVGGDLIAGVQANRVKWQFLKMPKANFFYMQILPKLPFLRRLFSPLHTFLALEGMYLKSGHHQYLPLLLESVLAHFKLHTALFMIDSRDPLVKPLSAGMGLFSQFEPVSTHVLIKARGLTADQMALLQEAPIYCSSFDYT